MTTPADQESLLKFTEDQLLTKPETVPISFTIIVKNNPDGLTDALLSLKAIAREDDEILVLDTGSTDGQTHKVASKYATRVITGSHCKKVGHLVKKWIPEWREQFEESDYADGMIMDFAKARQDVTDRAEHDWIFWLDSDDIVSDPDGCLRELLDRLILSGERDSMMLDYNYAFNEQGQVTTILKRERLFDRTKYHWKGKCHETAIPIPGAQILGSALFPDLKASIDHVNKCKDESHRLSDIRNYVILRAEVEADRRKDRSPDPRSIYYLGNASKGLKRNEEAIDYYKTLINTSGSKDDRWAAAYAIGLTYMEAKRVPEALDWYHRCQQLNVADPRSYYMLSRCHYLLGKWQEAIFYFQVGRMLPEPKMSLHTYDPTHIHILPLHMAILSYKEMGDVNNCAQLFDELRAKAPNHEQTKNLEDVLGNWMAGQRLSEATQTIMANLEGNDVTAKYDDLRNMLGKLVAVPPELEAKGLGAFEPEDERDTGLGDVVFFCGGSVEAWGPENAKTGIGGSERMVIEMAPRLQKLGFRVSVYANVPPDQRGLDNETEVNWQHFSGFDYKRKRGTVIFWRSVKAVEMPIHCERRIVWLHDVQNPFEWTSERIETLDQAWFLSNYHAATAGEEACAKLMESNKLIITRNGLCPRRFKKNFGIERDPKKVVFFSSPDRGILTAMKTFREAKRKDPKGMEGATLHLFYGFTKLFMDHAAKFEYYNIPDVGRDVNAYEYMKAVYAAIDGSPDIVFHGRVSFDEAAKHMCSAGVWLYPTRFPEISCMGAMEAQAAGCAIVATDYAALAETIDWRTLAEGGNSITFRMDNADSVNQGAKGIVKAVQVHAKSSGRQRSHDAALDRFSLDSLAEEWGELIQREVE